MTTCKIELIFHAFFREITKTRKILEEISDDCTINNILTKLVNRYGNEFDIIDPSTGKISNENVILLNGKSIRETNIKVKDKDVLIFSLPFGGG